MRVLDAVASAIVVEPQDRPVVAGRSATFSVVATGRSQLPVAIQQRDPFQRPTVLTITNFGDSARGLFSFREQPVGAASSRSAT